MLDNFMKEAISWIVTIAVALIIALAINNYLIVNANVPTGSMENTIMTDDRLIANRLSYIGKKTPKRGDIIVFKYPDDEEILFIKRVIGLPGETIEIKEGLVYINNSEESLIEEYLLETPDKEDYGPYFVPEGCYFVMGDNRNDSRDARFWENKFVTEEKILGRAVFRYYPKPKIIK